MAVLIAATACEGLPTGPESSPWIERDSKFAGTHIAAAAFGGGCFVIVGEGGTGSVSCDDGASWEVVDLGVGDANVRGVTYADGAFVAVGSNGALTLSRDRGRSWTGAAIQGGPYLRDVAFGDGTWVVVGDGGLIQRSEDLNQWTPVTLDTGRWISVIYGRGSFVASGSWQRLASSPDARTWTLHALGATSLSHCELGPLCNDVDDVAEACGAFVVVTHPELAVQTSLDLRQWTRRDVAQTATGSGFWVVRASDRLVVAAGAGGMISVSRDCGATWYKADAEFERGIIALAIGNGVLLAGGLDGRLKTVRLDDL
jgi:photosystem II stability/assembly factor-like uncharacterized protein